MFTQKYRMIGAWIKSGQLNSALKLFDEMPLCDVVTYNLLISGQGRYGLPKRLFTSMLKWFY
jgi:pentatricopeptide repeat protein